MDSKLPSQKCRNSGFHWMKLSRGLKWCTEKLQINLTHFSWVEYTNMSHLDPLWGPLGTHNDSNRTSPPTKWSHLLSHLKVHKPPKDFERQHLLQNTWVYLDNRDSFMERKCCYSSRKRVSTSASISVAIRIFAFFCLISLSMATMVGLLLSQRWL